MNRRLTVTVLSVLLSLPAHAAERVTETQIRQLMKATDAAALQRDAAGIGVYLSEFFVKVIEFPHQKWMAKVRLGKDQYLELINDGWANIGEYDYQRNDIKIHIMQDGLSGLSYSTITENMVQDGRQMTSKFREYALYALENGKLVITKVDGHRLVGDTTP